MFPGLFRVHVLVDAVCKFHHAAHGRGVFAVFVGVADRGSGFPEFCEKGIRHRGVRHFSFKAREDEACGAARDVDVFADEFTVHARHKVRLREVHVFDAARQFGGEVVAEPFGVHAETDVFQGADARAAGLTHLASVDGHKAVHVDVIRYAVGFAGELEHRRPEERVKVDDVLADEVNLFGRRIGEFLFKVESRLGAERLEACEVPHGGVEPHVEIFARGIRNFNAEIRGIAGNIPVGHAAVGAEPFFVLGEHFGLYAGFAVRAVAARPFAQKFNRARVGQFEEVVRGLLDDRRRARQSALRVLEIRRGIDGSAHFAAVAVLILSAALGAGALDEAVGEEHVLFGVVELFDVLGVNEACSLQTSVDVLREFMVLGTVGAVPKIKLDVEIVQVFFAARGDFGDELLGRDALFLGSNHDGGAVRIVRAHPMHVVAAHSFVTHPDVGLDVFHDVADVEGTVGVWKRRCHEKIAFLVSHRFLHCL